MEIPKVPEGFVSLIIRCATVGIIPIAFMFHQLTSRINRPQFGALSSWLPFFALALAGLAWQAVVSTWVPEPYLDEIFHIPQAQKYCDGKWTAWDDKITTPPGLYIFSVAAHRLWWLLMGGCSPLTLRMTNWLAIITLPIVASQCRRLLEARLTERAATGSDTQRTSGQNALSFYSLHSGVNIAFFPLLFFFSGLYYTDVLSTLVVLVAFWNTLERMGSSQVNSVRSDLLVVLIAIASLFMRQTNVFWVVVFMGGLEAVHAAGALRPPPTRAGAFDRQTKIKFHLSRYSQGEIHDPPLNAVSLDDVFYCALSIAIAVVCNPFRVLRQIWAHILTMVIFAGFVFWNGGVVLGDKSNHVATIHLPQMLYIWPLFAFFSAPLLLPTALQPILSLFNPSTTPSSSSKAAAPTTSTLSKVLNILGYASLLPIALAIVKFNTIIHPFTLADNRHYMFYVFRYSILRASWVRYALVPIYIVSGILCLKTLSGTLSSSSSDSTTIKKNGNGSLPKTSTATATNKQNGNQDDENTSATSASTTATTTTTTVPPTLSTALLFLLTTTLSLMTAPLVEPRYFIIPWVIWRLLLPAWFLSLPPPSPSFPFLNKQNEDVRLWLETAWFGVINLATMYIFITKPFRWPLEDGLQRFMW